jgi:hypothetical protein
MLKFLETPDIHYDPLWADITETVMKAIADAAEEYGVDFIALPGDLYNRPLYASDKGGLNRLRAMVKRLTHICPLVAVEGTPSHDGKGCYGPLEDCGLVLLRPGKMYGFYRGADLFSIKEINPDVGNRTPDAILFGIPELSKQSVLEQLELSADQASGAVVAAFDRYVDQFIAPRRAMFPDIPAVGLLHGVVSDSRKENSTDRIVQASDIVIRTETLARAGLDRWSLGHFHTPHEFTGVCAGYAGFTGIDDAPWGQLGFVPAMNLVTIGGGVSVITRIPYGPPRREKLTAPLAVYDPAVAYWLDSDDPDAERPAAHPWSRVTVAPRRIETQRVTAEQAANVAGLADLFRLIDPTVTDRVLAKVATIAERVKRAAPAPVDVSLQRVTVKGCKLFHGRTMTLDINALQPGLTAITGLNGDGKSSIVAFCTMYPVIVGKDTASGRASALKDFFDAQESNIEKHGIVNGVEHRHLIQIKGAHTQSPRVECYLWIDGVSQLETTSWDEMFARCEELYGSFADYLITSFYVQPQQSRTAPSGLMMATMTDIRDLVQAIAGIDREEEKRYALDQVSVIKDTIEQKKNWIAGAEENLTDEAVIEDRATVQRVTRLKADETLHRAREEETAGAETVKELETKKTANDREVERKRADDETLSSARQSVTTTEAAIKTALASAEELPRLQALAADIERRDDAIAANRELKIAYDEKIVAYNKELNELRETVRRRNAEAEHVYDEAKRAANTERDDATSRIKQAKRTIETINTPCVKCGYISPDTTREIEENHTVIAENEKRLAAIVEPVAPIPEPAPSKIDRPLPVPPVYEIVQKVYGDAADIAVRINAAVGASARMQEQEKQLAVIREQIVKLDAKTYSIDTAIDERYTVAKAKLSNRRHAVTEATTALATINATIDELDVQIKKLKETRKRIEEETDVIDKAETDLADWNYIATMLAAAKIPALELSMVGDIIDAEATRLIEPIDSGRYSFQTVTQGVGKQGLVDRFDILVHDAFDGSERSFVAHSPGEKAVLNDAYVKALVVIRNNRMHRRYSPIITDEADGPLHPSRVSAYYEIQRAYYADTETRVLVISHAPDGHNYIQNAIAVADCMKE